MKKFLLLYLSLLSLTLSAITGKYPDAAVVLLSSRENTAYQIDGTAETTDVSRYRIMNYDGLLQMRTVDIHFNSTYGTAQFTTLEIEKPDGRKITLDPARLGKVSIEPSQMQSRIYDPAQKILSAAVPGLEIGDILTVGIKRQLLKPRIPGQWSDICVLQADFPIVDYHYTINAPSAKPLQSITVKNELPDTVSFTQKTAGDRIIYSWHARNVPQAIPEPAMPALYTCCQRVLTSTVKDWQEISRWYDKLCAPRLAKVNDAMQKKTAELTAGKDDDMAKINALFQFVSQQIRYTGITAEEDAPGYEPHDVSQTFDRRHGVCRDKAALLVAMLRLADIKAYPVLFMSGTPKDPEVPNIYFNHAIVTAVVNGEYVLMDPTFETTRELLPAYMAGDSFLVAKPNGDTLRKVPPVAAEKNLLTIETSGRVNNKGSFSGNITLKFTGTYDQMYRAAFSEWSRDETQEFFSARLQKLIPGAVAKSCIVTPDDIRNMHVPLAVKIEFAADNYIDNSSGTQLFAMPRLAQSFGMLETLYTMTGLNKRQFPLRALPRAVKERSQITFPENIVVTPPPPATEYSKKALCRFSSLSKTEKNSLIEEHFFAIDSMLISPQEYPELKNALVTANRIWKNLPLLDRKPELKNADSVILEHREEFFIHDAFKYDHTAYVKRKILNYAGMSAHSELSIPYIEGIDSVEISGRVTAPDGTIHTLDAKEFNRMDAPGSAAMPRYPRIKIAVASFPNVIPGSIIEYTVKAKFREKYSVPDFIFRDHTTALKREVVFNIPAGCTLAKGGQYEYRIPLNEKNEFHDGRHIITFSAENIPALPKESHAPELHYFAPVIYVNTGIQADFAAAARKIAAQASPKVRELAGKITAGKNDLAAIDALRKYVSKNIRGVEYPLNIQPMSTYSLPQVTLADGYGSSADRAILLAAFLDAAGIKYKFVPAAADPHFYRTDFTGLLLALPEYPGIYLNDGGPHSALGAAHHRTVREHRIRRKLYPAHRDMQTLNCRLQLHANGDADVTMIYRYSGTVFEREAERFAKLTPELRRRYFASTAAAIAPQAQVVDSETDFSTHPGKVTLKLKIPQYAIFNGKFVSADLPGFQDIVRAAKMPPEQRTLPCLVPEVHMSYDYRFSIPEKWRAIPGKDIFETGFLSIRHTSGRCTIQIDSPELSLSPSAFISRCRSAVVTGRPETGKITFLTE
ncbi:MAG: DUF3857 domain-containing protein [Lentisphaeria bacterium]|nr:DUF3857 domain-containing protein [Lentisphaeria bacterium]